MLLVILICAAGATSCDRIVQPVDSCANSAFAAQVILAQTQLYDGTQSITWTCEAPK